MKLAVAPALVLLASCANATPVAVAPKRVYPPYRGPAVVLFDDAIEPDPALAAFEPGASSADSHLLRDRTQLGDSVARVRVVTVTSTQSEAGPSWRLGLRVLETIAGKPPADADLTLQVGASAASAGILRSFEGRLIERPFIVFLRAFARAGNGEGREVHFHLAGEQGDQLGAVQTAALMAQVR